jgi:hypothetical protein
VGIVTRITGRAVPYEVVLLDLMIGPTEPVQTEELTVKELELAWAAHGERMMRNQPGRPGEWPWAHWFFDLGEEMPASCAEQVIRLAELGQLSDEEIAALAEHAHEARIGTTAERVSGGPGGHSCDAREVELYAAVKAALPPPPTSRDVSA